MVEHSDVVIVGAGFTGLSAARELLRAGVNFVLLEARDRVGGRVEARRNSLGELIDTGGQFLCDDMPELMGLAREHQKTLVEAFVSGLSTVQPAPQGDVEELYRSYFAIRERMKGVDPDDPAIRHLTVAAWVDAQPDDPDAKSAFLSAIEGLWCQPPDATPLWYLISNDRRVTNEISELQYFLRETMHSLALDLARPLGPSLRLGAAVTRIEHGCDGVRIHSAAGIHVAAEVIVAVPPVMAGKIAFDPPLPATIGHALAVWKSGVVVKALLRFSSAFWRERGLSGTVFWLDPHGLYACDASHDDDHPALVVFVGGRLATRWAALGEAGLKDAIVSRLAAALGAPAARPIDILIRDWSSDGWSGGGYSDIVADIAARKAEDILREGLAQIRFACSELSPSFPGYIEGAIIAGRIAAKSVIADLHSAIATSASGS